MVCNKPWYGVFSTKLACLHIRHHHPFTLLVLPFFLTDALTRSEKIVSKSLVDSLFTTSASGILLWCQSSRSLVYGLIGEFGFIHYNVIMGLPLWCLQILRHWLQPHWAQHLLCHHRPRHLHPSWCASLLLWLGTGSLRVWAYHIITTLRSQMLLAVFDLFGMFTGLLCLSLLTCLWLGCSNLYLVGLLFRLRHGT